jgi:hypothetical protein
MMFGLVMIRMSILLVNELGVSIEYVLSEILYDWNFFQILIDFYEKSKF